MPIYNTNIEFNYYFKGDSNHLAMSVAAVWFKENLRKEVIYIFFSHP